MLGLVQELGHSTLCWNARNDRYNKKLKKYYVVYEEGDEEVSEDEERVDHVDQEVSC